MRLSPQKSALLKLFKKIIFPHQEEKAAGCQRLRAFHTIKAAVKVYIVRYPSHCSPLGGGVWTVPISLQAF